MGGTTEKAEAKLRGLVPDEIEYARLVEELHRKRPEGKPPRDHKAKAIKELERLKKQV